MLGKWGAVAAVGMLIAVLSCFSFLPAQWLLRSDTLAAMFQFGLREAVLFLALLLPFAAALSALLMAVAIRCKSFKEAQANTTVVILAVSLLPLVTCSTRAARRPGTCGCRRSAQNTLMKRVLKGEAVAALDVALPLAVCALMAVAGLASLPGSCAPPRCAERPSRAARPLPVSRRGGAARAATSPCHGRP